MPNHNIKPLLYGLVTVLLVGAGVLLVRLNQLVEPVVRTDMVAETAIEPEIVPVRVEARWLLVGEVFWGRRMEQLAQQQPDTHKYLFSGLSSFKPELYDAWVAHLECPVTDKTIPFSVQAEQLIFNCRPEYLPTFADWFEAVSLANNHMDNVSGVEGLEQTRKNLQANGVQYYGHYDSAVLNDICEVVSLPARLILSDGSEENILLPVALCGFNNVFRLPTETELDQIRRYSEHFFTIVSPQQGAEYEPKADAIKRRTYRSMIDRGADLVVASHPHWVQDSEVYKGKLIMYSVGNFMFDQEWSEETKRGAALDVILSADSGEDLNKQLKLAESCLKFQDDCLDQKLPKPDFTTTFDLVSSYHENGVTRRASNELHQLNINRTNWDEIRLKLNPHD